MEYYENSSREIKKLLGNYSYKDLNMKNKKGFNRKIIRSQHPKMQMKVNQDIVRCFARDLTATKAAKIVGRDVRTINPFYQWLRMIVSANYRHFLRFQEHDIDAELGIFLAHSAMMTMYWLNTDNSRLWNKYTTFNRGVEGLADLSTRELLEYTNKDVEKKKICLRHMEQNNEWLTEKFIEYRMKKFRTGMRSDEQHSMETIYRFLITIHVLLGLGIDGDFIEDVTGRYIFGENDETEKVGVMQIDRIFEKYMINLHSETKAGIIFSDLMNWLDSHPEC